MQPPGHLVGAFLLASALAGCSTVPRSVEPAFPASARLSAIAFNHDGSRLLAAKETGGTCVLLELDPLSGSELARRELPFCPNELHSLSEDSLLLRGDSVAAWEADEAAGTILAAASRTDLVRREGEDLVWVRGDRSIALPRLSLRDLRVLNRENLLVGILVHHGGESLVRLTERGEQTSLVNEPLLAIDSYDVSPDQKEFVISARRRTGYDVALGSMASAAVRWVATDPLDEVMVSWAPRGSKITYLVRGVEGSLLRSLHVPTGYELMVDLSHSHITALAWEPRAESFAVVTSGPGSSSHIEILAYGGEGRRILLQPDLNAPVELEPFLWPGGSAWLSRPARIGYGSVYPVVAWTGIEAPFAWSDERGAIQAESETISMLVRGGVESLTPAFWEALEALPWADQSRVFVVDSSSRAARDLVFRPGVTVIGSSEVARLAGLLGEAGSQ